MWRKGPASGGCVGLADHDGHDLLEPCRQAAGRRHREAYRWRRSSRSASNVPLKPRPPAAWGERDLPPLCRLANSMIDLQAGHGARERCEDLTDEGRVGDVGILVAGDPRVVVGVGVIIRVVMIGADSGLQAEVLNEVLRHRLADAGREAARE